MSDQVAQIVAVITGFTQTVSTTPLLQKIVKFMMADPMAAIIIFILIWFVLHILRKFIRFVINLHARNLVYLHIILPRGDSKLDTEKRTQKDFKEKVALMREVFRAIYETRDLIGYSNWFRSHWWHTDTFSLEMIAHDQALNFYLISDRNYVKILRREVTSVYPSADISEIPPYEIFEAHKHYRAMTFQTSMPDYKPIRTYQNMEDDPFNNIGNAFSKIRDGEKLALQIIIKPKKQGWQNQVKAIAKAIYTDNKPPEFHSFLTTPFFWIIKLFFGHNTQTKSALRVLTAQEDMAKRIGEKSASVGFDVAIRAAAISDDKERTHDMLSSLEIGFNVFKDSNLNTFNAKRIIPIKWLNSIIVQYGFSKRLLHFWNKNMLLTPEELSSVYHFPDSHFNQISIIKWLDYKVLPAPVNTPTEGITLGNNVYQGDKKAIHVKRDDRTRHIYVIGKSGSGKSVLLNNMAIQDIENNDGVCVVDPHGDLVEDTLVAIPKRRAQDTVIFDASDTAHPVGMNILEVDKDDQKDRAALDATEIFIKIFGDEIFGPRIQHYFRNACLTLMDDEAEGATLIDVPRMFTDEDFQKRKVKKTRNPVVRSFWEHEYANTGERERQEMIPYFSSKFGPFITDKVIRNIIGQAKSGINIRQIMDNQKILLVNLSKGKIGNLNAQLLGLIFVNKISMSAMSRQNIAKTDRKDFFLYVDEFQNFATDTFASILSEARKYRLAVTMAHQYIDQLTVTPTGKQDTRVRDAVFGNVGSMISFKIGARDAEFIEKEYAPELSAQDIIGISNYKAYMKLNIDNSTSRPFSIKTLYFPNRGNKKVAEIIRKLSSVKYGVAEKLVNQEIENRIGISDMLAQDAITDQTEQTAVENFPDNPITETIYDNKTTPENPDITPETVTNSENPSVNKNNPA